MHDSLEIKFLGGAREVGRSACLVKNGNKKILLDYGVKLSGKKPMEYPMSTEADVVFLSHAHLDHSGHIPHLMKKGSRGMVCATDVTFHLSELLLKDSFKIAKKERLIPKFTRNDIKKILQQRLEMPYHQLVNFKTFQAKLTDAGHIPGSAGVFLKFDKKSIFYTGDIQLSQTRLLGGARDIPKADVLITESTYSGRLHPERKEEEKRFINEIKKTVDNNGTVLIPCFAVGRAQELLLILDTYLKNDYMVCLDGMAKDATDVIKYYQYYLKDKSKLLKVSSNAHWLYNNMERKEMLARPCIIVTTAGMVEAGPVLWYLKNLYKMPNCSVLMPGYLVEGSEGRRLLETGKIKIDREDFEVKMNIKQFDFSSHADKKELFEIIRLTKPEKVFCVHGDECPKFAKEIEKEFGVQAFAPKLGEEFVI